MGIKPVIRGEKKLIGELLIEDGIIDSGQLEEALTVQKEEGGKVVQILIDLDYLDTEKVARFLAAQPGVPSIDLTHYTVADDVVSLISREFALTNEIFPIDRMGKLLTVGMAFPLDSATIKKLEEMTHLRIKALLCHPEDIRNAITQYYEKATPPDAGDTAAQAGRIKAGVRVESLAGLIRQVDGLPTLPQTVERVQAAAQNPQTSLKEIARIVSQDPAISARLLKLANSAAYGFVSRVDHVELATSLLGLRETCMVVMSSAIIDTTSKSKGFDHGAFWRHAMECATAAREIAAACGQKKNPGIFTAGLLCDIGQFALSELASSRYSKIPSGLDDAALHEAEQKAIGIGHPEAGYLLADHWLLPMELAEPIRFHLAPQHAKKCPLIVSIVALAAHLADVRKHSPESVDMLSDGYEHALDTTKLSADDLRAIYEDLGQEAAATPV